MDLIERAERAIILRLPPPIHELIALIRELEDERDVLQARVDELHGSMKLDGRFMVVTIKDAIIECCAAMACACKTGAAVEIGDQQFIMGTQEGTAAAIEASILTLKNTKLQEVKYESRPIPEQGT